MIKLFALFTLAAIPLSGMAASSITVSVSGTLHAPTTCSLSNPGVIDFGDVLTDRIDGNEYEQEVPVNLTCANRNPLQSVNVQINVPGASNNLIPVSGVKGFDLALKRAGNNQNLNTPFILPTDGPLALTLTPVKNNDTFTLGAFTATATIVVSVI